MNKKLLVAFLVIIVMGGVSLLLLKLHSVEIVQAVVVNAVIQKAPEGYDQDRIRKVFNNALAQAEKGGNSAGYLDKLQKMFHSLEKRQYLEQEEMDNLLADFETEPQQ